MWERVADELEEVEADGSRGFVLADDLARLASPPAVDGVRLLPPYDPLLMLRDRYTLVPGPFQKRVWRSTQNRGVVLDGCEVVATWRARKQGRRLVLTVAPHHGELGSSQLDTVENEAQRLPPLRGCELAEVVFESA